ncbi:MAG: hypothetical protein AB7U30_09745 [Sulfuricellaceae bacterium]
MIKAIREHYANFLTSAANLALIVVGVQIGTPQGWMASLGVMGLLSFVAWGGNLRRSRLIKDTPTSRMASAAQGYVELVGVGKVFAGQQLVSKLSGTPCLWFKYRVERRSDDRWESVEEGRSDDTFLLDDGSGECVIDPDGAEVISSHRRTWIQGDYRHTEWRLLPGDYLYAIGEFVSIGGANTDLDLRKDVGDLLGEWKQDRERLLARFDTDDNGEIDPREWGEARRQATRQVETEHREIRLQDSIAMLRKPRDGRLFLVSNLSEEALTKKYFLWGWFHLIVFFGATLFFAYFYVKS